VNILKATIRREREKERKCVVTTSMYFFLALSNRLTKRVGL